MRTGKPLFLIALVKDQQDLCAMQLLSHVQLFVTLWTIARQAPLSMEFSRQEYWSGLPCPPPRDLPNPGCPLSPTQLQCPEEWYSQIGQTKVSCSSFDPEVTLASTETT